MGDFFTETDDGVIDSGEAFGSLTLAAEEFDYTMSLMDFVDDIVHGTDTELRSRNNVFQTITVIAGQQRQQREHQGDDQAELPVQIKQDADQTDDNHGVAGQHDKYIAGVADGLFRHLHHIHQNRTGRGFLMEFGRKLQHLGKHIAAQMADCHNGDPSQQICADIAADASNDDQKDKKYRHDPDFIGRPPNQVSKLVFPILQRGDDAACGIEFGRRGRRGEALVDQGCNEGGEVAFGGGNAEDSN